MPFEKKNYVNRWSNITDDSFKEMRYLTGRLSKEITAGKISSMPRYFFYTAVKFIFLFFYFYLFKSGTYFKNVFSNSK